MIYYWDKKLKQRLHVLETNVITMKKQCWFDVSNLKNAFFTGRVPNSIKLVSAINNCPIIGLHLFWDTQHVMVHTYVVMEYSSSIYTDWTWHSLRSPPNREVRIHYSLGGAGLGHTSVGTVLSVLGSGEVCPGSCGSRLRFALTGILKPQGDVPQPLTLFGGARFIAWRWRCPFLGECRGAWGILGKAGP